MPLTQPLIGPVFPTTLSYRARVVPATRIGLVSSRRLLRASLVCYLVGMTLSAADIHGQPVADFVTDCIFHLAVE